MIQRILYSLHSEKLLGKIQIESFNSEESQVDLNFRVKKKKFPQAVIFTYYLPLLTDETFLKCNLCYSFNSCTSFLPPVFELCSTNTNSAYQDMINL